MSVNETTNMQYHDPAHQFERGFWGDCTNTFAEEDKQLMYAARMGLTVDYYAINVGGKRILDIGGGPVSLLLKCNNLRFGMVVDPIRYPDWVYHRYTAKGVATLIADGENLAVTGFDEVWIYNVLQHCYDPAKIVANARRAAPVLRLFEWIDIPPYPGHPQMLTEQLLTQWVGSSGATEYVTEKNCYGTAFYGAFK